jgi:hypothetical protein
MATLEEIAVDMERQAKRRQVSVRTLPRGLNMELVVAGGQKTLSLARASGPPAEQEVEVCRQAFQVPADAQPRAGGRTVTFRWTI